MLTTAIDRRPTRGSVRIAAAGASVALVLGALAAAPATAAAPETPCAQAVPTAPATGAVFSDPLARRAGAVTEHLCALIKSADPGSTIRIAAFVISGAAGEDYVQTLLDAADRGVNIRLVLDGWQDDSAPAARLIAALGTDQNAGSWVAVCSHASPEGNTSSCQGTKGQHNKFHLFSSVAEVPDVVVQSSANVTDVNHVSYWNNAAVVTGNSGLYNAYSTYHADLALMQQDPDYYRVVETEGADGPAVATFFPAAEADPILARLEQVQCTDGLRIDVGISEWDATRTGIAGRLAELAEAGCTVRVVHGPADAAVTDLLDAAEVPRRVLDGGTSAGRLHSKYLVVNGGPEHGAFVLTGSHNYNGTSLRRNDETVLELRNAALAEQYRDNANRLWAVAAAP